MNRPEIIVLLVVVCGVLLFLSQGGTGQSKVDLPKKYPYKKAMLLTNTEHAFFKVLKQKCDQDQYMICPKVRMEDFLSVTATDKKSRMKYRGHVRSRHIDFLLCDANLHVLAGIELDDKLHNEKDAQAVDRFKDGVFEAIGVPLFRIKAAKGTYETAVNELLNSLGGGDRQRSSR